MKKATALDSRRIALITLAGGCAIVASAGAGIGQTVQIVPQAGPTYGTTNVVKIHKKLPKNHTHYVPPKWKLSKIHTSNSYTLINGNQGS